MTVSARTQITFWGITSLLLLGFVYLFKAVLTPFVLGAIIAYLLNPLVKRFSTKGRKRTASTIIVLALFFIVGTILIAVSAPIIAKESAELIEALPSYINQSILLIQPYLAWFQENIGAEYNVDIKDFLKDNISRILSISGNVANGIAAGGQAVIGALTVLFLTPLVAFFMMKEWPAMTDWVESLIPRDQEK
mgnify:CR=1 FL=1